MWGGATYPMNKIGRSASRIRVGGGIKGRASGNKRRQGEGNKMGQIHGERFGDRDI